MSIFSRLLYTRSWIMRTVHHSTYNSALGYTAPFSYEGKYTGMETKETHFCGRPEAKRWDVHYRGERGENNIWHLRKKPEITGQPHIWQGAIGAFIQKYHIPALRAAAQGTQKSTLQLLRCCAGQHQGWTAPSSPLSSAQYHSRELEFCKCW